MNDKKDIAFGMSYAAKDLLMQLRAARIARGLSQKELGERVGLPQSNIARLESGETNPRIANLIEIARALDLDLTLVPRKALPAVQGALRASDMNIDQNDATSRALHSIKQWNEALARIDTSAFKVSENLQKTLKDMEPLRFDQTQFRSLQDAFKPLQRTLDQIQLSGIAPSGLDKIMRDSEHRFRALRNQIAHGARTDDAHLKPAFALEDDDDD